jgi:hypothetical protein
MLKCLVIKYTILPMTEYVEIICPTKDATFLTYTVLRTDKLCQHIVDEVKIDLIKSGLVPKAEKSFWQSVKRIVWLGTMFNMLCRCSHVFIRDRLFP